MDITRNGQTVSFIIDNGDLMQVSPYVSKAGDAYREMTAYRVGEIIVEAQDRALARQAAREWTAKIAKRTESKDQATPDDTDAAPGPALAALTPQFPEGTPEYAAYAKELRAELAKFSAGEPPYGDAAPEPEREPKDPAQVLADAAANVLLGATGAMDEMAAALAAFNASRRPA